MHEITSTFHILSIKNISYVGVFLASIEYIGFEPHMLGLLTLLMLIDVCAGTYRVYRNSGGVELESRLLRKGLAAKLMLLLMVFSIGITALIIGFEAKPYLQGAVSIIALGELYSIIGNIHSARTGQEKVEFDAVAFILRKLRDILDNYVK